MKRNALTLVELLVVIAIIGLLSTVAVVALGSARSKARDTRRLADLRQMTTAFQLAMDTGDGTYPGTAPSSPICLGLGESQTC